MPGSPADAYHLLRAAVEHDDPVLYFEPKAMLNTKGELAEDRGPFELGRAAVVTALADHPLSRPGEA